MPSTNATTRAVAVAIDFVTFSQGATWFLHGVAGTAFEPPMLIESVASRTSPLTNAVEVVLCVWPAGHAPHEMAEVVVNEGVELVVAPSD